MLAIIKGEIDCNTVIVREVNTPLTTTDRSCRQKSNKETQILKDVLDDIDLIDMYKTFHVKQQTHFFFYQERLEHFLV